MLAGTHAPRRGLQLKPSEGPPSMSPVEQDVEAEEAPGGVPEARASLIPGSLEEGRQEVSRGGSGRQ
jgi:hypothetical protein